jgi:cell division protein ZapA (FtsZ GTPase activity inhibitor)
MSNVEVNILQRRFLVKSDKGEAYVKEIETYLNGKAGEVKRSTKAVSTLDVALLTVLNVAGDYFRVMERLDRLENRSSELAELISRRIA